jgi:hypothetical protein
MKRLSILISIILLVFMSCTKDNDISSELKGRVYFKAYTVAGGNTYSVYSGNSVKFTVEMQLSGSSQNLNADIEYHLLDGSTKIGEGNVKVNKNIDGGVGMFWGADEHTASIDGNLLKGKTITIYLDPSNKYTGADYTSETYVNLYKKTSFLVP